MSYEGLSTVYCTSAREWPNHAGERIANNYFNSDYATSEMLDAVLRLLGDQRGVGVCVWLGQGRQAWSDPG
ncbi:MAG TPA: hypothetical protein DCY79_07045, partial [Planctomycetaceae bacterium]|nr:hypothetical protein [Planctomycetaceae bacterium]